MGDGDQVRAAALKHWRRDESFMPGPADRAIGSKLSSRRGDRTSGQNRRPGSGRRTSVRRTV
ncbi:MAG: hypothetical protein ACK5CE_11540, partial [Actinomycetes bacterium]